MICCHIWSSYYSLLGPSSVWSESSSRRTNKSEFESSCEYSQGPVLESHRITFVILPFNTNISQWSIASVESLHPQDHHRGLGVFEKVWGFTKTWFSKISKHRWEAKRNRVLGTCRALGVGGESRLSARTYLKHRSDIGAKWGENVEAKWGENEAKLLGIHSKKLGPIGALQAIRLSVNVRGEKNEISLHHFFSRPVLDLLNLLMSLWVSISCSAVCWSLKYSQTDLNYPKVASFEIWVTFEMLKSVPELTLCDDAWYWVVLYWVTGVTLVLGRVKISKTVDLK